MYVCTSYELGTIYSMLMNGTILRIVALNIECEL